MVTYRLQNFPMVCVHCLEPLQNIYSSIDSYHADLGTTVDQAIQNLLYNVTTTSQPVVPPQRDNMIPDRICKHCLDAIVTYHKFRRRMECVRSFSAGLAQLIRGNPADLIELFTTEAGYLPEVFKSLHICASDEQNITIEHLIEDLSSFELIDSSQKAQYTFLETATEESEAHANSEAQVPLSSWHVPGNDLAFVSINGDCSAEEILPDTRATDVPVVVLYDSDDEMPMEVTENNGDNNTNERSLSIGSTTAMGDLTQSHCSLPPSAYACQNTVQSADSVRQPSPHYCTLCKKHFKTYLGLQRHTKKMHEPPPVMNCPICSETIRKDELNMHKETVHHIQCYFYCNICLETFTNSGRLAIHTSHHKTWKLNQCSQCLKMFPNLECLQTHTCITYRDDYLCCGKEFAGYEYYNIHMRVVHGIHVEARVKIPEGGLLSNLPPELGGMHFYCKHCKVRFENRRAYHTHIVTSHNYPLAMP